MDECLDRIAEVTGDRRGHLEQVEVEEIVVLNLHRAVLDRFGIDS